MANERIFKEVSKDPYHQQILFDLMTASEGKDASSRQVFTHAGQDAYQHFFLVYEKTEAVACALLSKVLDECELYFIGVSKEKQGQGLGTFMLENILNWCETEGSQTFYLEVRESNTPAQKLYEKFGFDVIAVRQNYYSNPKEDALIMNREVKGGKNKNV